MRNSIRVLSLGIGWYCLLKKSLKILAFSTKFETSLSLTNKGGMIGAFFLLVKVLITDQYVLDEVLRLLGLFLRRLNYLFFERFKALVISVLLVADIDGV